MVRWVEEELYNNLHFLGPFYCFLLFFSICSKGFKFLSQHKFLLSCYRDSQKRISLLGCARLLILFSIIYPCFLPLNNYYYKTTKTLKHLSTHRMISISIWFYLVVNTGSASCQHHPLPKWDDFIRMFYRVSKNTF